ncbi:hypothetical protein ACFV9E_42465 [Streptomyces sp. NPDC059835]|uniref:hypothetical protein n=1 Tax=Streptomyces sp. NPDC059835 TaxID=3346967 RepID=UPI0036618858
MKKATMFVLAAGVLLTGCGEEPDPRKAYETAYEHARLLNEAFDGREAPGKDGPTALALCAGKRGGDEPESVRLASWSGCVDGAMGKPSRADTYEQRS